MDISFALQNYIGLTVARLIERLPSAIAWLRSTNIGVKPFVAARLRGDFFPLERDVTFPSGVRMHLVLSDDVQRQIYLRLYEPEEVQLLSRHARRDTLCVDVGANVGWFALHLAQAVGSAGHVIAVEADPRNAERLRGNAALNAFGSRIQVVEAAASERVGTVSFIQSAHGHSGWGSVVPQPGNAGGQATTVATTTVDSLIAASGHATVSVLKIDVEGHELAVLAGSRESLREGRIGVVFFEFSGRAQSEQGVKLNDFVQFFSEIGYTASVATARVIDSVTRGETPERSLFTNLLFTNEPLHS